MNSTPTNGLRLLETLAEGDGPRGVTQLARAAGLTKSNAHRLLRTLCDMAYARRRGDSAAYELTLMVPELGNAARQRLDMVDAGWPHMRAPADRAGETVHLAVLDRAEIVSITKVDGPQPLIAYSRIGGRARLGGADPRRRRRLDRRPRRLRARRAPDEGGHAPTRGSAGRYGASHLPRSGRSGAVAKRERPLHVPGAGSAGSHN